VKRLPLVVLALLVVVGVAGCGGKDTTPLASGIPSTTAPSTTLPPITFDTTTTPVGTEATVLADCRTFQARPAEIIGACGDAGIIFSDLRWDTWQASGATGTGSVHLLLCDPACASGGAYDGPARVELGRPVGRTFSEIVVTWVGTQPFGHPTDTYSLPTEPLSP